MLCLLQINFQEVAERLGKVLTYAVWHLFGKPTAVVLANPFWAPTLQFVADGAVVRNSAAVREAVALNPPMLGTQRGSTSSCCQVLKPLNKSEFLEDICSDLRSHVMSGPYQLALPSRARHLA